MRKRKKGCRSGGRTLPNKGGARITPFNLQEEKDEGRSDADGNYFLNQDVQIQDNWPDNMDWEKIKNGHLISTRFQTQRR